MCKTKQLVSCALSTAQIQNFSRKVVGLDSNMLLTSRILNYFENNCDKLCQFFIRFINFLQDLDINVKIVFQFASDAQIEHRNGNKSSKSSLPDNLQQLLIQEIQRKSVWYVVAPETSMSQLVHLQDRMEIDVILSDDLTVLMYKANKVIFMEIDPSERYFMYECQLFDFVELRKEYPNISYDILQQVILLFSNNYSSGLSGFDSAAGKSFLSSMTTINFNGNIYTKLHLVEAYAKLNLDNKREIIKQHQMAIRKFNYCPVYHTQLLKQSRLNDVPKSLTNTISSNPVFGKIITDNNIAMIYAAGANFFPPSSSNLIINNFTGQFGDMNLPLNNGIDIPSHYINNVRGYYVTLENSPPKMDRRIFVKEKQVSFSPQATSLALVTTSNQSPLSPMSIEDMDDDDNTKKLPAYTTINNKTKKETTVAKSIKTSESKLTALKKINKNVNYRKRQLKSKSMIRENNTIKMTFRDGKILKLTANTSRPILNVLSSNDNSSSDSMSCDIDSQENSQRNN